MKPASRSGRRATAAAVLCLLLGGAGEMRAEVGPELEVERGADGTVRLRSPGVAGAMLRLEVADAPDAGSWVEIGRFHDEVFAYPDAAAAGRAQRFYRMRWSDRVPADDWKNQIVFPVDAFCSPWNLEAPRWVKFAILTSDPAKVYYQDSAKFPFHYDFATARLEGFAGMTHAEFDDVSLRRAGQRAVLGAVLFPSRSGFAEYGVQFAGQDVWTFEEVSGWIAAVRATIQSAEPAGVCYVPAFEQRQAAEQNAARFGEAGIVVTSVDRWMWTDHRYATGWAIGRLRYIPAAEVSAAFADGRLKPEDILLTDDIATDTPMVAGIVSLAPSTPNSHTAILAQSFGIPFVHLGEAADRERAVSLDGRQVILRAGGSSGSAIRLLDVEGLLDPATGEALLALKAIAPIEYTPKEPRGAIAGSVDALTPADIRHFGGKAVNYGFLRRAIPKHCPEAVALSFDLWDAWLDQPLPGAGRSLREEIAARLAPYDTYPPQIGEVRTVLEGIRELIRRETEFTADQRNAVLDALAGFDPNRKIRFRSSTNVEDSETFTGAGLYDSYSGCLADELDADDDGPCLCDPGEPDERGVFRAIRRVYAGFYNENAWLERLRHGVDESEVGMAVLVHHSFPDEEELANGVATLECNFGISDFMSGKMVTQKGAESVANPDGNALPEVVEVFTYNESADVNLIRHSSRLPLGATVMDWQDDYRNFLPLFRSVAAAWNEYYPGRSRFTLDFEYKKDVRTGLVVKQVRGIPPVVAGEPVVPFLIDEPGEWVVAQREAGDVFANHRLKSVWDMRSVSRRLNDETLATGLYLSGSVGYLEGAEIRSLDGPLTGWPDAGWSAKDTSHTWSTGSGAGRREWSLLTEVTKSVTGATPPVFTADEFPLQLTVRYATPVPALEWDGSVTQRDSDFAVLERRRTITPGSQRVLRRIDDGNGIVVETLFYWPDEPGLSAGYTAPVVEFGRTWISGLTTEPIRLNNYWSQTYRPGHHNFTEDFIFEPRLDPGVSAAALAELNAADIRYIHVQHGVTPVVVTVAGLDGKLRRL